MEEREDWKCRGSYRDPNHDRHEEMLDWIGEYDPEAFSTDEVNSALTPFQRRRKAAKG